MSYPWISHIKKLFSTLPLNAEEEQEKYFSLAYPGNHTFTIHRDKLRPKHQLKKRYEKITTLYPSPLKSIVDIACSKGYFIFSAEQSLKCERALGIDVDVRALNACHWLQKKLSTQSCQFQSLRLHELADQIQQWGGPFQVALVINVYQYLYFGSLDYRECYLDHNAIFQSLRKICDGRVIFNNRMQLSECRNQACIDYRDPRSHHYTEEKMLAAAEKYFKINFSSLLGKYPFYAFDAK